MAACALGSDCVLTDCTMTVALQELSRRLTAAMKEAHGKSVAGEAHMGGGAVGHCLS